jgi:hypothetical protein
MPPANPVLAVDRPPIESRPGPTRVTDSRPTGARQACRRSTAGSSGYPRWIESVSERGRALIAIGPGTRPPEPKYGDPDHGLCARQKRPEQHDMPVALSSESSASGEAGSSRPSRGSGGRRSGLACSSIERRRTHSIREQFPNVAATLSLNPGNRRPSAESLEPLLGFRREQPPGRSGVGGRAVALGPRPQMAERQRIVIGAVRKGPAALSIRSASQGVNA